jgi:hypothetical protein
VNEGENIHPGRIAIMRIELYPNNVTRANMKLDKSALPEVQAMEYKQMLLMGAACIHQIKEALAKAGNELSDVQILSDLLEVMMGNYALPTDNHPEQPFEIGDGPVRQRKMLDHNTGVVKYYTVAPVTLIRKDVCACGAEAIEEHVPIGKKYKAVIDYDKKTIDFECGRCGKKQTTEILLVDNQDGTYCMMPRICFEIHTGAVQ